MGEYVSKEYQGHVAGFFSGIIGTLASYPIDTTRIKCQGGQVSRNVLARELMVLSYSPHHIVRNFRGVLGPLLGLPPGVALSFGVQTQTITIFYNIKSILKKF